MHRALLLLASAPLILFTIACSSESETADTPSAPEPVAEAAPTDALAESCRTLLRRQRECVDQFAPAIVDLSMRIDPAAAKEASERGVDALNAQATQEFAGISDDVIAQRCEGASADAPDELLPQLVAVNAICAEKPTCDEFVPCMITLVEAHMTGEPLPDPSEL